MPDSLSDLLPQRPASAERPLFGVTLLLVEDSRLACEAVRLMCLRSGARLRRADCLRAAERHLRCYRPGVVIVDLGLPDGSGLDLIGALARQRPRLPALIATSGDLGAETAALAAGADRFLPKPVESLASFQALILSLLPDQPRAALEAGAEGPLTPDPLALHDDLARAAELLDPAATADLGYVARFLSGLALSAHDPDLRRAAEALLADRSQGPVRRLSGMLRDRLAATAAF